MHGVSARVTLRLTPSYTHLLNSSRGLFKLIHITGRVGRCIADRSESTASLLRNEYHVTCRHELVTDSETDGRLVNGMGHIKSR
jgi:hypothetical protein